MENRIDIHIKGCLANNLKSQEWLYRYCFERLMKVCLRYHSNEIDASSSFNKSMHKVFGKLGQYRNDGHFLGWVHKIIVNTCLNELRSEIRNSAAEIKGVQMEEFTVAPDTYSNMSEKEILLCVQQLPSTARIVFNLYVMENYNHAEVGKLLNISEGTSKWHLNQARALLKQKLIQMNIKQGYANEY